MSTWENPELTQGKKKKKKGIGGLVEKIKVVGAHAIEKMKEPSQKGETGTSPTEPKEPTTTVSKEEEPLISSKQPTTTSEEGVEVPHDIARNWGAVFWLPVQQDLEFKSSLPQATSLSKQLGITEAPAEDDLSLKGKNFDVEKSKPLDNEALNQTIAKARALEESQEKEAVTTTQQPSKQQGTSMGGLDFLRTSVGEARKMGEKLGTTSPRVGGATTGSPTQESKLSPLRSSAKPKTVPALKLQPPKPKSTLSGPDFLSAHLAEARKLGEKMGTTSPKAQKLSSQPGTGKGMGKLPSKSNLKSMLSNQEMEERHLAADFLKSNLKEARKLGEKMGTTSPKFQQMKGSQAKFGKSKLFPQEEEGKLAADFLKSNVKEARKLGEKMGTTSPKATGISSSLILPGALAADYLIFHVNEARKLGEKMGTTSPKVPKGKKTEGKTEISTQPEEGKLAADFLKAHVNEARRLGEKMGTTSPKTMGIPSTLIPPGSLAADYLKSHIKEARKLGEKMGTTSPKVQKGKQLYGKSKGKVQISTQPEEGKLAADFLKSNLKEARRLGEQMGTTSPKIRTSQGVSSTQVPPGGLAADYLKSHVKEARNLGEKMGTTSPKIKDQTKVQGKPQTLQQTTQPEEGNLAADFLKAHVREARQLGEKMGTTSPHVGGSQTLQQPEGKLATDFLKAHVEEARKLGEQMGTTSPKLEHKFEHHKKGQGVPQSQQPQKSAVELEGTVAADFLRQNLNEARKLGEKKGTTSPKGKTSVVSAPTSSGKDFTSGFKEKSSTHEPKTGIDFLRETVGKARELGEKKGTTSPKPESMLFQHNQLKEEARKKQITPQKE